MSANTLTQFSIPVEFDANIITFVDMTRLMSRVRLSVIVDGLRPVVVLSVEDKLPVAVYGDDNG